MPPQSSSSPTVILDFSFGQVLKGARTAQGLTLQQLATDTRIRADYLKALEDGDLAALPERTYARSFLQQYARQLKLDPAPLLAQFDQEVPAATTATYGNLNTARQRARATKSLTSSSPANNAALLPMLLGGVVVLVGGLYYASRGKIVQAAPPVTQTAPPAPQSVHLSVSTTPTGAKVFLDNRELGRAPIQSFPAEARKGAVLRAEYAGRLSFKQNLDLRTGRNLSLRLMPIGLGPSVMTDLETGQVQNSLPVPPPKAPPVPVKGVTLTFTGDSWLRVTSPTGQTLFEGMAPAGSTKTYDKGVTVRAGNAGAVRISVDGSDPAVMGLPGQALTQAY